MPTPRPLTLDRLGKNCLPGEALSVIAHPNYDRSTRIIRPYLQHFRAGLTGSLPFLRRLQAMIKAVRDNMHRIFQSFVDILVELGVRAVELEVDRELLSENFARNILSWKQSGFSIDNSVRILDQSSQESLAEYIARPPITLKKIRYEPFKARVLFHTTYSECFRDNPHMFDALDFLAELTQHIPPKRLQLIRRYGLYASRTKGRWEQMPWVAERAPGGWKTAHQHQAGGEDLGYEPLSDEDEAVDNSSRKRAWARLLAKVYEVDPFVCPRMHARTVSVSERPAELRCRYEGYRRHRRS